MNLYRINYGVGKNATYALITEATEGKAVRQFRKVYPGQEFSSVELVRENASATKDQERKAVEQIRAIIATLGPDSYTATALDGCLDIAESNIENDFADSWKGRCECAEKEVKSLREKLDESVKDWEAAHEAAHQIAAEKDAVISSLRAQVEVLQKQVLSEDDLTDVIQLVKDLEAEDEETAKRAAAEIVNYAEDSASEEFTEAVRLHRTYAKRAKYSKALRLRIEAAQNATAGAQ